jgi:hypothetical protein
MSDWVKIVAKRWPRPFDTLAVHLESGEVVRLRDYNFTYTPMLDNTFSPPEEYAGRIDPFTGIDEDGVARSFEGDTVKPPFTRDGKLWELNRRIKPEDFIEDYKYERG